MTDGKLGRPATSAAASSSFFQRIFDQQTGELRIERRGPFWDAVTTASRMGAGAGRLVAVIDYGFDLTIDEVRRDLHPSSVTTEATVEPSGHHGTVIALLIRAVAPVAQLLLFDAYSLKDEAFPSVAIADAIRTARSAGADVINLSCESRPTARSGTPRGSTPSSSPTRRRNSALTWRRSTGS